MAVQVIESDSFEDFVDELRKRPAVRLVKLADHGFVGPLKTSWGAVLMAPQLRIVATAFDRPTDTLVRWESVRQADTAKSVAFETVKGAYGDMRVVRKKEDLRDLLELDGFLTSYGEWTTADVERLLTLRQTVA